MPLLSAVSRQDGTGAAARHHQQQLLLLPYMTAAILAATTNPAPPSPLHSPLPLQVDDMLSQAHNVTSSLLDQRRTFDNVGDKLAQVGDKFPVVAGLLNAIRRKKSRVSGAAGRVLGPLAWMLVMWHTACCSEGGGSLWWAACVQREGGAVLCCAVLCCAVLCCAVLCCAA
jgi:hypothetical protein